MAQHYLLLQILLTVQLNRYHISFMYDTVAWGTLQRLFSYYTNILKIWLQAYSTNGFDFFESIANGANVG